MENKLILEKQQSLAQDHFRQNGVETVFHIVAKNTPFLFHISAPNEVNINMCPLIAKLCYNSELDQKEVETLKSAPLEYTSHVSPSQNSAIVEMKISVLSSQHERSFFIIHISVTGHPHLKAVSGPIKVLSKKNQVQKLISKQEASKASSPPKSSQTIPSSIPPSPSSKRLSHDQISETLSRLEQQQNENNFLLQQMYKQKSVRIPNKRTLESSSSTDSEFRESLEGFLIAYGKIPKEERRSKLQKLFKSTEPNEMEHLLHFVGCYCRVTKQDYLHDCQCKECPHKKKLELMDEFYSNFVFKK